jgi:RNA polymerase sigma factor (sigma-70 family)
VSAEAKAKANDAPPTSDRDALARLRAGNSQGFDWCYQRYQRNVYSFLLRLSGRTAIAEDLYQDTWLRFAERAATLRPDSDVRSWLLAVARNLYVSRWRRSSVTPLIHDPGRASDFPAPVGTGADQSVAMHELETALMLLPGDERELLLLVGVEGLSQDVVAKQTGVAHATIRQRVTRARAHLTALLNGKGRIS